MSTSEPATPADPSEPLKELLVECLDLIAEGGMSAAEPVLAANPRHAPVLRERLRKLQLAGLLPEPEPSPEDAFPERLGDFRLLRRLGSGGMGVVYLAVQESLGRQVALKLVRPEQMFFPGARERFRREVEAIARLNDPGIVPIFTVGEDGGIPFFAMEYVVGMSLSDLLVAVRGQRLEDLSGADLAAAVAKHAGVPVPSPLPDVFAGTWILACCRIAQRIALAIEHAHARGVLHRDIKPSNAMITPTGRVLVLDFGLASAAGATRVTRTGSQPGTLCYMAPEQVRGDPVDARTDVYALGVTLYEMLAGRAPYEADSGERLRHAILEGVLPRLRTCNPAIPIDLETICSCALDRDGARRYPSASAFADDLRRFLEHRPIAARPSHVLLRLRRWARRRPARTAAVVLALLCVAATPIALWQRSVLRAAAEQNLRSALVAVQQLLVQLSSSALSSTPGLDPFRSRQLEEAVRTLAQLRKDNDGSEVVRQALAKGLLQVAQVRRLLGQSEAATGALDEASAELERLLVEHPEDARYAIDLARASSERGDLAITRGDVAAATANWHAAIERLQGLAAGGEVDRKAKRLLAGCRTQLAAVAQTEGEIAKAEEHLRIALKLGDEAPPTTREDHVSHGQTRTNLAMLLSRLGRHDEALAELDGLRKIYEALVAAEPSEPECRRELARTHCALGRVHEARGDPTATRAAFTKALEIFDRLVGDFPGRMPYRSERGLTERRAAMAAMECHDAAAAEELYRRAIRDHEELLAAEPLQVESRAQLATMLCELGGLLGKRGDDRAGTELFARALAEQREIVKARPADPFFRHELGNILQNLGMHEMAADRVAAAVPHFQEAVAVLEQVLAEGRELVKQPAFLPNSLLALAQATARAGDRSAAVAALARRQQLHPEPRVVLRALGRRMSLLEDPGFLALLAAAAQ